MTCIIGYIENEKVFIGGDSASVGELDYSICKNSKVFKVGKFLIGGTSSFRMMQLLRFSFKPPKIKKKELFEYMCTDFANSVKKCFKDGGFLQKFSDGDDRGGIFLIGVKGRLFKMDLDFQIEETILNYASCGCGEAYAISAFTVLEEFTTLGAKQKIIKALSVAQKHTYGVSPPFVVYSI